MKVRPGNRTAGRLRRRLFLLHSVIGNATLALAIGFSRSLTAGTHHQVGRLKPRGEVKEAMRVAEDAGFYEHEGIDYDELREAIQKNLEQGKFARGASTITQQLAKNLFLSTLRKTGHISAAQYNEVIGRFK